MKKNHEIELNRILKAFNHYYGFNIIEQTRKQEYFFARCVFFKVARNYTKVGLAELGRFSGITHASVINALNTFDLDINNNTIIKKNYNKIMFLYSEFFKDGSENNKNEVFDNKIILNKFEDLKQENQILKLELIKHKQKSTIFKHDFVKHINNMPLDILNDFYKTRFIPYSKTKNLQLND
jgi:hypothetical protein